MCPQNDENLRVCFHDLPTISQNLPRPTMSARPPEHKQMADPRWPRLTILGSQLYAKVLNDLGNGQPFRRGIARYPLSWKVCRNRQGPQHATGTSPAAA